MSRAITLAVVNFAVIMGVTRTMALMWDVESNERGRLTIPAQAREALHVEGKAHWQVEVTEEGLLLRPALVIPREDAWAYTPEHLALVESAREDERAGRISQFRLADLEAELGGSSDES